MAVAAASRARQAVAVRPPTGHMITTAGNPVPPETSNTEGAGAHPVSVIGNVPAASIQSTITASEAYMNQRRGENASATSNALVEALKKIVRTHLFHRVKFITCSKDELEWGGSIQKWIYQNLGFTTGGGMKDFWETNSDQVRKALNKKRGNAGNEVKSSFTSKLLDCVI